MATKLKDGLFIGDAEVAQDVDFVEASKIGYIVNCAGAEVPNQWEHYGMSYLTFDWEDHPGFCIFDANGTVLLQLVNFIDEALENFEGVLIHCTDGNSRSCTCAVAYLMRKYNWELDRALDFLVFKNPDLQPNPGFIQQLHYLDLRLQHLQRGSKAKAGAEDEILLSNTYINSQPLPLDEEDLFGEQVLPSHNERLTWIDTGKEGNRNNEGKELRKGGNNNDSRVNFGPERPPGRSYNATEVEAAEGWLDMEDMALDAPPLNAKPDAAKPAKTKGILKKSKYTATVYDESTGTYSTGTSDVKAARERAAAMSKQADPQQSWQPQQGSGQVDSPLGFEVHGFDEEGFEGGGFEGGLQRFDRDGGFADGFGSGGDGGRNGGRAGQNIAGEGEDEMMVGGMMEGLGFEEYCKQLEQQGSSRVARDMQQAAYREQQLRQQGELELRQEGELELRQERGQAKARGKQAKGQAMGQANGKGGKGQAKGGKGFVPTYMKQQQQQQQQQQRRRRRRRRTDSSEPTKHRISRGSSRSTIRPLSKVNSAAGGGVGEWKGGSIAWDSQAKTSSQSTYGAPTNPQQRTTKGTTRGRGRGRGRGADRGGANSLLGVMGTHCQPGNHFGIGSNSLRQPRRAQEEYPDEYGDEYGDHDEEGDDAQYDQDGYYGGGSQGAGSGVYQDPEEISRESARPPPQQQPVSGKGGGRGSSAITQPMPQPSPMVGWQGDGEEGPHFFHGQGEHELVRAAPRTGANPVPSGGNADGASTGHRRTWSASANDPKREAMLIESTTKNGTKDQPTDPVAAADLLSGSFSDVYQIDFDPIQPVTAASIKVSDKLTATNQATAPPIKVSDKLPSEQSQPANSHPTQPRPAQFGAISIGVNPLTTNDPAKQASGVATSGLLDLGGATGANWQPPDVAPAPSMANFLSASFDPELLRKSTASRAAAAGSTGDGASAASRARNRGVHRNAKSSSTSRSSSNRGSSSRSTSRGASARPRSAESYASTARSGAGATAGTTKSSNNARRDARQGQQVRHRKSRRSPVPTNPSSDCFQGGVRRPRPASSRSSKSVDVGLNERQYSSRENGGGEEPLGMGIYGSSAASAWASGSDGGASGFSGSFNGFVVGPPGRSMRYKILQLDSC
jgi:protein-tyrosine phosphatase